jgi:hypothetical protein
MNVQYVTAVSFPDGQQAIAYQGADKEMALQFRDDYKQSHPGSVVLVFELRGIITLIAE